MSFQGDVAGIGLGELLQGLARGGRDGVLSLYGENITSSIGLQGGQLFILASPEEDENLWRERAQRAWADNPSPELETTRRITIARAERLEIVYRMLEAPNLTFRFEQGPLPAPPPHVVRLASQGGSTEPWGPGVTVEYLLLEHARIADESSDGVAAQLRSFDMPRALDPSQYAPEVRDFLTQCDGLSTLQEISDRLGWTLTQTRALIGQHLRAGTLRLTQAREMLAAAQRELHQSRPGRAASRLTGWVRRSAYGPAPFEEAQLLIAEWEEGQLSTAVKRMEPRDARSIARKLDHAQQDSNASRSRWRTLTTDNKADEIACLHEVSLRLVSSEEPDARTFQDLLHLARNFQERGNSSRARTLLRLATNHLPARLGTRVELGKRMLASGLEEEGKNWLLETARELIQAGDAERAMVPVRAILKADPEHEEANALAEEAKTAAVRQRRRRWNILGGTTIGVLLSGAAVVKFQSHREMSNLLEVVEGHIDDPSMALQILNSSFPGDERAPIQEMRERLEEMSSVKTSELRRAWLTRFKEVEEECLNGDPILCIQQTLELEPPPGHQGSPDTWPERQDLLGALASRLGDRSAELDLGVDAGPEDLKSEARLASLLKEVLVLIDPETAKNEVLSFRFRVAELHQEILDRREDRTQERDVLSARAREKNQDILLATARAHDRAGDLEKSLAAYDELLESDPHLSQIPALQEEVGKVRKHWSAVSRATELAQAGQHEEAREVLQESCENPEEHLLPWSITTRPTGAQVRLADGSTRTTPFDAESAIGQRVELSFELEGHYPRTVTLDFPQDVALDLNLLPERSWKDAARVQALPVAVGDDHVVADRRGNLARLDRNSKALWETKLETLGGIRRTPIFLPELPGKLLVLTEDGEAWLLDANDGELEGPVDLGSPPTLGPIRTRGGVSAAFADGRVAVWNGKLKPRFFNAEGMLSRPDVSPEAGVVHDASMVDKRAALDIGNELICEASGWKAIILSDAFRVVGPEGRGFTVSRTGPWEYIAWEAPKTTIPLGRLWVSDAKGLRSYVPHEATTVTFD